MVAQSKPQNRRALAGMLLAGSFCGEAVAEPPDSAIGRMEADVATLVALGPRPSNSPAERAATDWLAKRLQSMGLQPRGIERATNLLVCQGQPRRILLAHIDSVPESPGAVDNAAGVAILLELAREGLSPGVCLGFPDREEVDLGGSAAFARDLPALELAISLELMGQGSPAAMGLGEPWGDNRLEWLSSHAGPDLRVPIVNRAYSRTLPWMERSDHRAFLERGIPGLMLFGEGEGEVFPRYHQAEDIQIDPEALGRGLDLVRTLANAGPLPPEAGPGLGFFLGSLRVSTPQAGIVLVAGLGLGLLALLRPVRILRMLGLCLYGCLFVGIMLVIGRLWFSTPTGETPPVAEATAAAVMGIPASGWWNQANYYVAAGVLSLLLLRSIAPPGLRDPAVPVLSTAVFSACFLPFEPLLSVMFAGGALAAALHPSLAILPALLLLRPDALRQLAFHGLIAPPDWGFLWLLSFPALGGFGGSWLLQALPSRRVSS
jgi:hypothetical protein